MSASAGPRRPLRVNARLVLPADELRFGFARSGGPGGQNVNKVESKVVLRFSVRESRVLGEWRKEQLANRLKGRLTQAGEIVVHASRYRDRARNAEDARERLARMLREALRTPRTRVRTRPTRASVEKRLDRKHKRARVKRERRAPEERD